MATVKIIVLSDGETWETLNEDITIMEITEEAYQRLCDGEEPNHLDAKDIFRAAHIGGTKEAN